MDRFTYTEPKRPTKESYTFECVGIVRLKPPINDMDSAVQEQRFEIELTKRGLSPGNIFVSDLRNTRWAMCELSIEFMHDDPNDAWDRAFEKIWDRLKACVDVASVGLAGLERVNE